MGSLDEFRQVDMNGFKMFNIFFLSWRIQTGSLDGLRQVDMEGFQLFHIFFNLDGFKRVHLTD
jgi:hypothetical protein